MKLTEMDKYYLRRVDYTSGTLRPPTELADKFPDPLGSLERAADDRADRIAKGAVRAITAALAVATAGLLWEGYSWLVK